MDPNEAIPRTLIDFVKYHVHYLPPGSDQIHLCIFCNEYHSPNTVKLVRVDAPPCLSHVFCAQALEMYLSCEERCPIDGNKWFETTRIDPQAGKSITEYELRQLLRLVLYGEKKLGESSSKNDKGEPGDKGELGDKGEPDDEKKSKM
jgi:hypothetical protein